MFDIGEKVIVRCGVKEGEHFSGRNTINYLTDMSLLQGSEFVVTQVICNVYGETAYRLSGKARYLVWLESWLQVEKASDSEVLFNG